MIAPIPVNQLVFKEVIEASNVMRSTPKVSPSIPVESVPLANPSVEISSNGGNIESSFPWGAILIGVGVLAVVGIIYYQLEKKREKMAYKV